MSRTKNRSDRRHNQLIIKHRDGSETAVTPMKPWTPPPGYVLTAHVAPDVQSETLAALEELARVAVEQIEKGAL